MDRLTREELVHQNATELWFVRPAREPAPLRLFWFPHSGGNASVIAAGLASLTREAELYVVQLPGRGVRLAEPPADDLGTLVAQLTSMVAGLTDRPYAFIGHSLGAIVAFEVARALRRQGSPLPRWLWACASEGPTTRTSHQVAGLPAAELIEVLRAFGGTPAEVLAEPELMEVLLPSIRADFALNEQYRYRPEPPLDLPIRVLRGDRDPTAQADRVTSWVLETTRPLPELVFPGDHFFLDQHRDAIIQLVTSEFRGEQENPYHSLPARSFWRSAVAEPAAAEIGDLWQPVFTLGQDDPILTAGSCFASQIGPALLNAGMNWHNAEPAPPGLTTAERAARHYGQFSFRTGNLYTAAMLRQWLTWACGDRESPAEVWSAGDRYFDPFRPSVEPDGFPSAAAVLEARQATLAAIRSGLSRAACLIFTLGLTEAWHDARDESVYPVCPGTVRGRFEAARHVFRNATFAQVYEDLSAALDLASSLRPGLRVVLTVSPVPLTATATGGHALVATTYSKSVLRAVAGQLAVERQEVDYFPSYELITGSPFAARFFQPNLRTVSSEGVEFVLRHFLAAFGPQLAGRVQAGTSAPGGDPYCDDAVLDYYRAR
jgi:surfactin synthase thioesterase subunit